MGTHSLICQLSGIASSFTILLQILVSQCTACSPAVLIISAVTPLGPAAFLTFKPCIACLTYSLLIMSAGPSTYSADSSSFHSFSSFSSFSKYSLHLSETCSSDTRSSPFSPFKQLVPVISFLSFFFCLPILKMFCLPSLESNVSAYFFITSACILAIHLLASFLYAWYSACFTSLIFFGFIPFLNFYLLVSTAFSTSSHHHQVSLYLHPLFLNSHTVLNIYIPFLYFF